MKWPRSSFKRPVERLPVILLPSPMATTPLKKFTLTYTDSRTNARVKEMPRLMMTADGKHKALFVGADTVLASVPIEDSDAELWNKARASLVAGAGAD
jgi:hypothetical protein